jgi:hypothetical protein
MDLRWKHPFTSIVCGPSSSGKSFFVEKFINNIEQLCDTPIKEIVWCYAIWQPLYTRLLKENKCKFIEGIPNIESIVSNDAGEPAPRLLVIDDLMREAGHSVTDIFTKGSHHRNMSIIFISQNLFFKGKGSRDVSLNTQYFTVFKHPRDQSQFLYLARQVYPKCPQFLQEAYEDATEKAHGYLLLDLKQATPDNVRFRTNIFPNEKLIIYQPRC